MATARKVSSKQSSENTQQVESTHYIKAKSSGDTDEAKFLSFYTNEGTYGDMISATISDKNIERFVEFIDFVQAEVEAGNRVYLNFNQKKQV